MIPNEAITKDSSYPDDSSSPESPPNSGDMDTIGDLTGQPEGEGVDNEEEEP